MRGRAGSLGVDRRKQGWHDKIAGTVVAYKEEGADR
jgi:uncharacterized RDD family membrane protein YckC